MINVRKNFVLLKDVPNILELSPVQVKKFSVSNGTKLLSSVLNMLEEQINHFTKQAVFKQLNKEDEIAIVYMPDYPLPVSYSITSKQIIINLAPFGTESITIGKPDPKNLYASLLYGLCLKNIVSKKAQIKEVYFDTIVSFILSMMIQMFGKEYGLLGKYSTEIPKLKFLLSCYVLISFFGIDKDIAIINASTASSYNITEIDERDFVSFHFKDIENLINALSEMKVMPGMTKYHFVSRIYKLFSGLGFLPVFEDLSRFISSIAASSVPGATMIPSFIVKYNRDEYSKILEIVKIVLRG